MRQGLIVLLKNQNVVLGDFAFSIVIRWWVIVLIIIMIGLFIYLIKRKRRK